MRTRTLQSGIQPDAAARPGRMRSRERTRILVDTVPRGMQPLMIELWDGSVSGTVA